MSADRLYPVADLQGPELYIHDDGSTDNTIAAVESYVEKYLIRYI